MRSQIGEVARLPIMEDSKSTYEHGQLWPHRASPATLLQPLLSSNWSWPTVSGYLMDGAGAARSGLDPAPSADSPNPVWEDAIPYQLHGSAVSELWGDFEWDDAA